MPGAATDHDVNNCRNERGQLVSEVLTFDGKPDGGLVTHGRGTYGRGG